MIDETETPVAAASDLASSAADARAFRSRHFRDLDGMRGLLSLCVVLLHFGVNSFLSRTLGLNGASFQLCVDVFFLLSGYVLTYSARNGIDRRRFVYRRVMRLAPVYFVTSLALAVILGQALPPLDWLAAAPITGQQPLNFPAWSVCWEFYLPVAAALVGVRVPDRLVLPMLAVCLIALGWFGRGLIWHDGHYFARALFGLAAGHLLYRTGWTCRLPFVPLVAAALGVMFLAGQWLWGAMLLPPVACAAILAGRNGGSAFAARPLLWLGDVSYTLYLVHVPVLAAMVRIWGEDAIGANPAAKLAGIATSLVLATLLTVAIERPFVALGRRTPWRRAAA